MKRLVKRNITASVSGPVEPDTAYELCLYIENDGNLYRQMIVPTIKNMQRKIKSGKYDATQAVKAWQYVADEGVRRYGKEFGNGSGVAWVNKNTRIAIAEELMEYYDDLVQDPDSISSGTKITSSNKIQAAYHPDDVDAMENKLYKFFGEDPDDSEFLTAVLKALSYDQKYEIYDFLITQWDVDSALANEDDDEEDYE